MKNLLYIFFFVIYLGSCTSAPGDYLVLDNVVYVENFPEVFILDNGTPVNLDVIGILSISIEDSMIIVTTSDKKGMWSFYSLPEYYFMGKYLTMGMGPNEFLSTPLVEQQNIFKQSGHLLGLIYDFQSGKLYKMNISETLQKNRLSMSQTSDSLPRFLFNFTMIDTNTFLCKEVNNNRTQQIRYVLRQGWNKSSRNLEKLNAASIRQGENINILATDTKRSSDGKKIVEVGIALNQINLYSIDDSFGKTICVGKQVDNINKIQNVDRRERMYTYINVTAHPNYFSALYLNDTDINYQRGTSKNPSIQFIDWDGKPLAEIKLDRMITSYAIDFIHGSLYVVDSNSEEELYKYDILEVLKKIKL